MIPHRQKYMDIWLDCVKQGWATQDARDYAQMKVDELIKEKEIKKTLNERKT